MSFILSDTHNGISPTDPVFVFASGTRCGSTLLQRYLCSHPQVMVWGEPAHLLDSTHKLAAEYLRAIGVAEHQLSTFVENGHNNWIPLMRPGREQLMESIRLFILRLFADSAAALGRPLWGVKDVAVDIDTALFLQDLFPGAHIIHLVRNVADCFKSQMRWVVEGRWSRQQLVEAVYAWVRINQGFLSSKALNLPNLLRLRYEDLVQDPASYAQSVTRFLGIDQTKCDLAVFRHRISDARVPEIDEMEKTWSYEFTDQDLSLLLVDEVVDTSYRLGYKPLCQEDF